MFADVSFQRFTSMPRSATCAADAGEAALLRRYACKHRGIEAHVLAPARRVEAAGLRRHAAVRPAAQRARRCRERLLRHAVVTVTLPILACHSFGPVSWTLVPVESTATVTGMSFTSNS